MTSPDVVAMQFVFLTYAGAATNLKADSMLAGAKCVLGRCRHEARRGQYSSNTPITQLRVRYVTKLTERTLRFEEGLCAINALAVR